MNETKQAGHDAVAGPVEPAVMQRPTPGPWKCVGTLGPQSNPSLRGPHVIEDARGLRLANIRGPWATAQSEADGRLMAAAPDLLAALEELMYAHTDKAEKMARDAINKAVGAA